MGRRTTFAALGRQSAERAIYEQGIRQAMARGDDMGGFNEKIMLKISINSLFALYYSIAGGGGVHLFP